jgi:hypothetical protein
VADGEVLVDPNGDLASTIRENQSLFASQFSKIRREARRQLISAAVDYSAGDSTSPKYPLSQQDFDPDNMRLFLAGHQPELFHPGVWFKNYFLSSLAKWGNGIPVNLIIDSDQCKSSSIMVPTGSVKQPVLQPIAIDEFQQSLPFENVPWRNIDYVKGFPHRVKKASGSLLGNESILNTYWNELDDLIQPDQPRGLAIARARQRVEQRNGLNNLEVPVSKICQEKPFFDFLEMILKSPLDFQAIHNECLHRFRSVNRLRSKTHPVPDLAKLDDWVETPFWIWSSEIQERRPLYAKASGNRVHLTDLDGIHIKLEKERLSEQLLECGASINATAQKPEHLSSVSIRPRALTTTLFVRLFIADVFVHGIGGAKYDALTDDIITRYFGVTPPNFITATSTNQLPFCLPLPADDEIKTINEQIRKTQVKPELCYRELEANAAKSGVASQYPSDWLQWAQKKAGLLSSVPQEGGRKTWHQEIQSLNSRLSEGLTWLRDDLIGKREMLQRQRDAFRLLKSREFSFVLHPQDLITKLGESATKVFSQCD